MPYVRNKVTGETRWVPDAQPPRDPTFDYKGPQAGADLSKTIAGTSNTAANTNRTVVQTKGDELQNRKLEMEIADLRRKEADRQRQFSSAQAETESELLNTINKMDEVYADSRDNGGWGETGAMGSFLSNIPGTAAYDLSKDISTIQSNTAFDRLQRMRDLSPTGGALGAVSEAELELLKNSVSAIDQGQSQGNFEKNTRQARQRYVDMLGRVNPQAARALQMSPEQASKAYSDALALFNQQVANLPPQAQEVGRRQFMNSPDIRPLQRRAGSGRPPASAPRRADPAVDALLKKYGVR